MSTSNYTAIMNCPSVQEYMGYKPKTKQVFIVTGRPYLHRWNDHTWHVTGCNIHQFLLSLTNLKAHYILKTQKSANTYTNKSNDRWLWDIMSFHHLFPQWKSQQSQKKQTIKVILVMRISMYGHDSQDSLWR